MCIVNMAFEVPESKHIDIEAFKHQVNTFVGYLINVPGILWKQDKVNNNSWTEEFRGKWQDDNMTAEQFVQEIRENRNKSTRKIVEL